VCRYDRLSANLSSVECPCAESSTCLRDDKSLIPRDQRPLWFSFGIQLSLVFLVVALSTAVAQGQEMHFSRTVQIQMRSTLMSVAYPRILTAPLGRSARGRGAVHQLPRLLFDDADAAARAGYLASRCAVAPLVVAVGLWAAVGQVGWLAVLAGAAAMAVFAALVHWWALLHHTCVNAAPLNLV
jgi:hypothetical protein